MRLGVLRPVEVELVVGVQQVLLRPAVPLQVEATSDASDTQDLLTGPVIDHGGREQDGAAVPVRGCALVTVPVGAAEGQSELAGAELDQLTTADLALLHGQSKERGARQVIIDLRARAGRLARIDAVLVDRDLALSRDQVGVRAVLLPVAVGEALQQHLELPAEGALPAEHALESLPVDAGRGRVQLRDEGGAQVQDLSHGRSIGVCTIAHGLYPFPSCVPRCCDRRCIAQKRPFVKVKRVIWLPSSNKKGWRGSIVCVDPRVKSV